MRPSLWVNAVMSLAILLHGPAPVGAGPETTLSLTISPSEGRQEFLPLLPVVLTAELKNTGGTAEAIGRTGLGVLECASAQKPPRYDPERPPRLYLVIQRPDGTTTETYLSDWVNWGSGGTPGSGTSPQLLGAGEGQIFDYCLGFGVSGLFDSLNLHARLRREAAPVFAMLGDYRIRMRLPRLAPSGVESNILDVTIRKPTKATDVLALEILSQSKWPIIFLTPQTTRADPQGVGSQVVRYCFPRPGETRTTTPLDICREILRSCPRSVYAPYAQAFLASMQALGEEGWLEGKSSEEIMKDPTVWGGGARLLRRVAEDSRLPRRFREEALLDLRIVSGFGSDQQAGPISAPLPSLEAILDGAKVSIGNYTALDLKQAYLSVLLATDWLLAQRRVRSRPVGCVGVKASDFRAEFSLRVLVLSVACHDEVVVLRALGFVSGGRGDPAGRHVR